MGAAEGLGRALDAWLSPVSVALPPVFPPERHRTLLSGACRLADMGARLHPDHRAELAFDQVLRAPIPGQTHEERAYLAAAVFTRYEADGPLPELLGRLLSQERLHRARALGLALRLGCDLSGRSPALLAASSLSIELQELVLTAHPGQADLLLSEQSRKRLNALAAQLELEPAMRAI
jgi:exopolyphosphatase/guanosine-5'-triphosphate,3'-diphosphate pyrophosphatase